LSPPVRFGSARLGSARVKLQARNTTVTASVTPV
jgi:hypothetical protein